MTNNPQRHSLPVSRGRAHLHRANLYELANGAVKKLLRFTSMDVGPEERLVIEPSMDVVLKFYQVFFFQRLSILFELLLDLDDRDG